MEERKKLLKALADCALQVWAVVQSLGREPSPNWVGVAGMIDAEGDKLKAHAAEMRLRVDGVRSTTEPVRA